MTDADLKPIIDRFRAWTDAHHLSQVEAARLCGISSAALSQTLAGKYAGNVGRIAAAMDRAVDRAARREKAPRRPAFAMTSVAADVLSGLETAHTEGCMTLIMGESGLGKTEAALRYVEGEPETVYIPWYPAKRRDRACSPRPVLIELAARIGAHATSWMSMPAAFGAVADALRGTGRLIIWDEADYLGEEQLQVCRMLHDATQCGMAFLATPSMLEHLRRKRSSTLQQFLNRLAYALSLSHLTSDDAEAILSPMGWDDATIQAAAAGAQGVTRRLALGAVAAQRLASLNGGKIDAVLMSRAYGQLMPA